VQPFPGGPSHVYRFISGATANPMCGLGWKSLGVLELTALPSVRPEDWIPAVEATDALLVWGGDPLYLAHWLKDSGLAGLMSSLTETVYVGVSAGSIAATTTFAETYPEPPQGTGDFLKSEDIAFDSPQGEFSSTLVTAEGIGLVDFAVIPHLDHEQHPDASMPNAEKWAARLSVPTYAIDDQTAIKVTDDGVEVISEGHWRLFEPASVTLQGDRP